MLIHACAFRVRHYECDAYGHVNNVNYLRYMQEAGIEASAAAGYDLARYQALGQHWLVRETHIEYLRPLGYGDTVVIKTWVADFRRVRSRRMYEFRLAAGDESVARAHTDWVYVNSATGQPATIPDEMIRAFYPEGQPAAPPPPRERFSAAPPPPPGVFKMRRMAWWQDIDAAGHVNNALYLGYISDCATEVVAAHGWPIARMQAAGFGVVVRRHQIEYREPAVLGDELEVATWAYAIKRATAMRAYTITRVRDGALLAQARTLYVWMDLATGRPIRIPPGYMDNFAPNVVS